MNSPSESRLADWLHGVVLDPGGGELEVNRSRVAAITAALGPTNVLDVLTYAYGGGASGFQTLLTAVREAGEETWAIEPESGLAVRLAAASLADRLVGDDDGAVIAALAIGSAAFAGIASPLADLPSLAEAALARIAGQRRRRVDNEPESIEEELRTTIKDLSIAQAEGPVANEEMRSALEKARSAVRTLSRRADAIEREAWARRQMVDEELDILWWSQAEASETLGISWRALGEEITLLSALELSGLQRLQPSPRSAPALIASALGAADLKPGEEVALRGAVEAVVGVLGDRKPIEPGVPAWFFPLSAAIDECQRKGGEPAWAPAYSAEFSVDPEATWTRLDLATQILRERSLLALTGQPSS
jgi:hypothetical protein